MDNELTNLERTHYEIILHQARKMMIQLNVLKYRYSTAQRGHTSPNLEDKKLMRRQSMKPPHFLSVFKKSTFAQCQNSPIVCENVFGWKRKGHCIRILMARLRYTASMDVNSHYDLGVVLLDVP